MARDVGARHPFNLSGVALAFLASWAEPYLPYVPEIELASRSVDSLLNIVASSMLAVTTCSMSIIVGLSSGLYAGRLAAGAYWAAAVEAIRISGNARVSVVNIEKSARSLRSQRAARQQVST